MKLRLKDPWGYLLAEAALFIGFVFWRRKKRKPAATSTTTVREGVGFVSVGDGAVEVEWAILRQAAGIFTWRMLTVEETMPGYHGLMNSEDVFPDADAAYADLLTRYSLVPTEVPAVAS